MQEDYSVTAAIIAVATFTLAGILLNDFTFRFPRFRPWLAGRARVVVRDGEPLLQTLAGERMTIQDVHEAARKNGIRRLRDVELCVLETDGSFSFFTRDDDAEDEAPKAPAAWPNLRSLGRQVRSRRVSGDCSSGTAAAAQLGATGAT